MAWLQPAEAYCQSGGSNLMQTRRQFLKAAAGAVAGVPLAIEALPCLGAGEAPQNGGQLVTLSGGAREVGRALGELNAEDIRLHVNQVLGGWRGRGLSDDDIIERSDPFRRFARRFAPFWLDEFAACAEAAGVSPDLFVAYNAGKYRALFFVDECTSYLAVGAATADGASLFHKTRDNVARAQSAYRKRIVDPSRPAGFYAVGDTSDTGLMMMVNEHGLAGSADVGGLPEDRPKGRGVMNPYILRLIAERAERCEDALEIVQETIRDGWYAGGASAGTHWLFADRFGKGLRVAQNSHEEKHWFFEDDVAFLARGNTNGAQIVREKKGEIALRDLNAAAFHPDICRASSISALTVRIDPDDPSELTSVWVALPAWIPYVPLFPAARGVPREVVDGTVFRNGYALRELATGAEASSAMLLPEDFVGGRRVVQEELYADAAQAERAIRELRERGEADAAAEVATEGAISASTKLVAFLAEARDLRH